MLCAVSSAFIVVCAGCRLQVCGNVQEPGFMLGEHRSAVSTDMLWPRYGLGLNVGHWQIPQGSITWVACPYHRYLTHEHFKPFQTFFTQTLQITKLSIWYLNIIDYQMFTKNSVFSKMRQFKPSQKYTMYRTSPPLVDYMKSNHILLIWSPGLHDHFVIKSSK